MPLTIKTEITARQELERTPFSTRDLYGRVTPQSGAHTPNPSSNSEKGNQVVPLRQPTKRRRP